MWSPRGDLIAFTKMYKGEFYIGVMKTDGSGERLLARGFLVEGPTWAPNGRVLMYYKQQPFEDSGEGGDTHLYRIDITGFNERRIITPADASDPTWSPLLNNLFITSAYDLHSEGILNQAMPLLPKLCMTG